VRTCVTDKNVQLSVHAFAVNRGRVSVRLARRGWEVRWRDSGGRHRSKRFASEEAAREFDASMRELQPAVRRASYGSSGGVYPYETASGTRWRCAVRRSDGSFTSKRGFQSRRAALDARRRLTEQAERGETRHTKETFSGYWQRWLARRKPYLEAGSWGAYERDGRLRLLPALGELSLGKLGVEQVRALMEELVGSLEDGEISAKSINNTLGTLVVCLNAAVEDGLMASNPALRVPRLPPAHVEREYLRLHEIPIYLGSCSAVYRPLAELMIGSGLRISEALALRVGDLELEDSGGVIVVYRSRKKDGIGSTKSDRFRAVEIGKRLAIVLAEQLARRFELSAGERRDALVFADRGGEDPLDRTTVSRDWHKSTLRDASLRDMPLHALRHTAAAAWLAAGNSLMYVQRQLGHSDISTTERYYGHLERHVLAAGGDERRDRACLQARDE
jgi:integrase